MRHQAIAIAVMFAGAVAGQDIIDPPRPKCEVTACHKEFVPYHLKIENLTTGETIVEKDIEPPSKAPTLVSGQWNWRATTTWSCPE